MVRPLFLLLTLLLVVGGTAGCTPVPVSSDTRADALPTAPVASLGGWPAQAGLSGVNGDPSIDADSVDAFCTWRGRPCGLAQVPTARDSWDSMTGGTWFYDAFAGFPGRLVITQSLVPDGRPQDMAGCAAGDHDSDWRTFGRLMVANGRARSIVRLGWEFNTTANAWAATDPTLWIGCFRRAATAIRAGNPAVTIEWTVNGHQTDPATCGGVSTNCWPGDDVVDLVGVDWYDTGSPVRSRADFVDEAARPDGLTWLLDFGRRHGKRFAVGEWGVAPGSPGNETGENAPFVGWMHDWFTAHTADLAYEAYFTNCDAGEVESNLYRPTSSDCVRENRAAAQVYRSLWGS